MNVSEAPEVTVRPALPPAAAATETVTLAEGAALSVTLVSHDGKACVGLACDQLAVTDPEGLEKCLHAALDELAALGKGGPA